MSTPAYTAINTTELLRFVAVYWRVTTWQQVRLVVTCHLQTCLQLCSKPVEYKFSQHKQRATRQLTTCNSRPQVCYNKVFTYRNIPCIGDSIPLLCFLTGAFVANAITTQINATQTPAGACAWIIPLVTTARVARKVSMATRPRALKTTASLVRVCLEASAFSLARKSNVQIARWGIKVGFPSTRKMFLIVLARPDVNVVNGL